MTNPWVLNADLNTIRINLNDLRTQVVSLIKEGDTDIGLLDLLMLLKAMKNKDKDENKEA